MKVLPPVLYDTYLTTSKINVSPHHHSPSVLLWGLAQKTGMCNGVDHMPTHSSPLWLKPPGVTTNRSVLSCSQVQACVVVTLGGRVSGFSCHLLIRCNPLQGKQWWQAFSAGTPGITGLSCHGYYWSSVSHIGSQTSSPTLDLLHLLNFYDFYLFIFSPDEVTSWPKLRSLS